jgi:ribosome assembly protein YihI (activator of Der GTPase)
MTPENVCHIGRRIGARSEDQLKVITRDENGAESGDIKRKKVSYHRNSGASCSVDNTTERQSSLINVGAWATFRQ